MVKRPRDKSFLGIAVIAAVGGVVAIAVSAAFPLAQRMRGEPSTPAFFFFGIWGFVALLGAAANVHTYLTSGSPPDKPPRGGVRVRELRPMQNVAARESTERSTQRAA